MLIRVERHELGPRVWLLGHRVHHFHTGALFVILGARLIWGDRADIAWPGREDKPAALRHGGALLARTPPSAEAIGVTTSHDRGVW